MGLRHWAQGPFELICHAEGHVRSGEDFDRRIALISFDNSLEVSITTYLTLDPVLRGNRSYAKVDVEKWLYNYHSKLDFLEEELKKRTSPWLIPRDEIIWAHGHRNQQYHRGSTGTPEKLVLSVIRSAALWVFGFLFDVPDVEVEKEIENALLASQPKAPPSRDPAIDRRLDQRYGLVEIGEQIYYASEVLFAVDADAYRALATEGTDGEDS